MTKIIIPITSLAEIASRQPDYSVNTPYGEMSNIRYRTNANGRRDRSIIECTVGGIEAVYNSDARITILD